LSPLTDTFGIIQKSFGLGGLSINASLNALENKGLVKTLAQPTLIALSGEKASFLAGGEFPVPVAQSGNNTNGAITVEFKPFGVSLAFTPTVLADRTISMIVEPEVSAIDPTSSLTVGNISIPGLRTRRASTTLELRDGESFAIAGLLQKDFQTTIDQVPLLSSIPILGALFRSSSFKKGETELLIVVTPHLVAPIRPNQVKLPTDRVQDPREGDTFLLGESYRPQPVEPAAPGVGGVPVTAGGNGTADVPAAKTKEDGYAF
jgi:pilus assembly protein CpaC